jgi:hypothetical protein
MVAGKEKGGRAMQRRLGKFFPIVMLAMLVQFFAPIGASWAFGAAASDPLHLAGICSDVLSAADSGTTDQGQAHINCCTLCCVAQNATPTGDVSSAFTKLERNADVVVWRDLLPVLRANAAESNAQARGPPTIS